jgi:hypothetical protein
MRIKNAIINVAISTPLAEKSKFFRIKIKKRNRFKITHKLSNLGRAGFNWGFVNSFTILVG